MSGYVISNTSSKTIIDDKNNLISSLTQKINQTEQEKTSNLSTIEKQEHIIKEQEQNITKLSDEITTLKTAPDIVNEKQDEIEELEKTLNTIRFENIDLKQRLGERLDWKKYENHDFSFEYPPYMELSNMDYGYNNGEVFHISHLDPESYFSFIWMDTNSITTDETADNVTEELDYLFEKLIVVKSEINGHDADIIHYTVAVGDGAYNGIMCIWECKNTGRIMVLFHFSSGDPLLTFFTALNTVKCHLDGAQT